MIHRPIRASHVATACTLAVTLLLGVATPAQAALVNMAPLPTLDGEQADAASAPLTQSYVAPVGGMVDGIVWWGFHGQLSQGAAFDSFSVVFNSVAVAGTLSTTVGANGLSRYELDIVDQLLLLGQAGSLEIVNDSLDVEWYWQVADAGTRALSFALLEAPAIGVPEPGSWPLAALSLLACASASVTRPGALRRPQRSRTA